PDLRMNSSLRIARNLSGFRARRQAPRRERGFTLIELMVTIGVAAILMAIAVNAWGEYRTKTRVISAAEEILSALTSARIRALTTHANETVSLDFTQESVATSLWSSPRVYKGVDLVAYTCSSATAYPAVTSNTITFTPRGTASGSAAQGKLSVQVKPKGAALPSYFLIVNSVTGSVRMAEVCP
ncbi:pilin, partial [Candidatus Parcubacteria bacterium]